MMKREYAETQEQTSVKRPRLLVSENRPFPGNFFGSIPVNTPRCYQPTKPKKYRKEESMILISRDFLVDRCKAWQEIFVIRQRISECKDDFRRWCTMKIEQAYIDDEIKKEGTRLLEAKATILASHRVSWEELEDIIGRVEQQHKISTSRPKLMKDHSLLSLSTSPSADLKSAMKKGKKTTKHVQFIVEDTDIIKNLLARGHMEKVGMYIKRSDLAVLLRGEAELKLAISTQRDLEGYCGMCDTILRKVKARRETLDCLSCIVFELHAVLLLMDFDTKCSMEYDDASRMEYDDASRKDSSSSTIQTVQWR